MIEYDLVDTVAVIRMNAPSKFNALAPEEAETLTAVLSKADKEARAILLGGVGKAFCAGVDLGSDIMENSTEDFDAGRTLDVSFNPLVRQLRDLDKPLVTEIRGAAAGVGCSIALMGDLVVASEDAYFLQAFCNIGLVPDGGSSYLLSRAMGKPRAMEMMLLGDKLPAPKAHEYGLINRVCPLEDLELTAMDLAKRLANGPTKSLGYIRKMAWAGLDHTYEEQLALERVMQKHAGRTKGFSEGVSAFLEKKKATFSGE